MAQDISISVIKRLPRYYRFLETLRENGIVRISSKMLLSVFEDILFPLLLPR